MSPCDVGDRRCPRVPVAAQTQRGSRPRRLPPCERQSGCSEDLANLGKRLLTCAVGCPLLAAVVRDLPAVRGPSAAQPRGSGLGRGCLRRSGPRDQGPDWPARHGKDDQSGWRPWQGPRISGLLVPSRAAGLRVCRSLWRLILTPAGLSCSREPSSCGCRARRSGSRLRKWQMRLPRSSRMSPACTRPR